MEGFKTRLRELREAAGMTQEEVARELELSRCSLTNYEAGTREPSFDTLVKICKLFDVSSDYLLGLTDMM